MKQTSLWGDDFILPDKSDTKNILDKINQPKEVTVLKNLKSKKINMIIHGNSVSWGIWFRFLKVQGIPRAI